VTTRAEAIQGAARILAIARVERDALSPREAAEAAWYPGHRLRTVEAIEELIIRQRADSRARYEAERRASSAAVHG